MIQNDTGVTVGPQIQRIASTILAVLLTLPVFISSPSMAGSDVPVDPALVLPTDPVWPPPPVLNPVLDPLSNVPTIGLMVVTGIVVPPVSTAQSGVPGTLP